MKKKKSKDIPKPIEVKHPVGFSERKVISPALAQALTHVKDFMTDPQKALVLLREGKQYFDIGEIQGGLDCFNEAISHNPSVTLFSLRGSCHRMMEKFSEAYFDYSFNIRIEPEVGAHYCNRGLCLAKLKKVGLALEDLNLAIEYDPSPVHYYSRATVNAEFNRLEDAIADFSAALHEERPSSPNLSHNTPTLTAEFKLKCRYRRGLVYFELGSYGNVIQDANEVLLLDAQNVPARALLGRAFKVLNEHQKAEEQLSNAILLDPHQANLYTERGDIRFRTGRRNKIIEGIYDFDQAVKLLTSKLTTLDGIASQGQGMNNVQTLTVSTKASAGPGRLASMREEESPAMASRALSHHTNESMHSAKQHVLPAISKSFSHSYTSYDETEDDFDENELLLKTPDSSRRNSKSVTATAAMSQKTSTGMNASFSSNTNNNNGNNNSAGAGNGVGVIQRKELEEQLADTYYKRAQAKLLIESESFQIEEALNDVLKAIDCSDSDDDYYLVASTCYLRLHRYDEARKILDDVLTRSPNNYKALYNLSYCKRIEGDSKDAIEELTKIIAMTNRDSNKEEVSFAHPIVSDAPTTSNVHVPIHRVYEMRGTLLHEVQAHKLALMDLGKAIAINPSQAINFYLRGDSHFKLGNYEQALIDFNVAESKNFSDVCSLHLSRGAVKRLLHDFSGAIQDFNNAFQQYYHKQDLIGQIRALSYTAFCHIDMTHFEPALDILVEALDLNDLILNPTVNSPAVRLTVLKREMTLNLSDDENNSMFSEDSVPGIDLSSKSGKGLNKYDVDAHEYSNEILLYCQRTAFVLAYHRALSYYMLQDFSEANQVIIQSCLSSDRLQYVPDDVTLGTLYFFAGQCQIRLLDYDNAIVSLQKCRESHFIDSLHNELLVEFAIAKILQCLRKHSEAIERFTKSLALKKGCPYCHFRRAWSYKALGDFVKAGDDFETAKSLRPNDPNFSIDYKHISKYEYMEIATEPDFMEAFPALLPVPGLDG